MKVVLSISASDSSGVSGIGADLKTFEAFGVFGCSVVTVLTAQNSSSVRAISEVEPSFVKEQLEAVFEDFEVSAIKIGTLYSNDIIDVVREFIKDLDIPIVFDPVFIATSNVENIKSLLPYCTLTTLNLHEAKELFAYEFGNSISLKAILEAPSAVVIKNHVQDINLHKRSVDNLYIGREMFVFDTPYRETSSTSGSGCSFSSAIAANLALGKSLQEAVKIAKKFVYLAIKSAKELEGKKAPIDHKSGGEICHLLEK